MELSGVMTMVGQGDWHRDMTRERKYMIVDVCLLSSTLVSNFFINKLRLRLWIIP